MPLPARPAGSVMFSSAVRVGMRLNAWKTKPIRSRRTFVRSFSESAPRSTSPMNTEPEVSSSSPATQCISVDLPEPDGPMMAVHRPFANPTVTPSRARTSLSPEPYTLTASRVPAASSIVGAGA